MCGAVFGVENGRETRFRTAEQMPCRVLHTPQVLNPEAVPVIQDELLTAGGFSVVVVR